MNIIRDVIDNPNNRNVYGHPKFIRFLLKQKYLYHLNNEEYTNFLVLFNFYNRNSNLYYKIVQMTKFTPEVKMISNTKNLYNNKFFNF